MGPTPHVNQLLVHIGNTPAELIVLCEKHDLLVEACSPIAYCEIVEPADVAEMAQRYSASVPQLCIRNTRQLGTVPLPKTANPDHMRGNAAVEFVISDEDMATLRATEFRECGESSAFPVYSGR